LPGARIAVIGSGHVGTVTAACFAELGHEVVAVDIDEALVARMSAGDIPFLEPGLGELVARHTATRHLCFTTSYDEALAGAGFVFLCVNTPATITGAADLRDRKSVV